MSLAWSDALYTPPTPSREVYTLEEWACLPEDVPGEFADGHLVAEEMPDPIHEVAATWFIALFLGWLGEDGFVVGSDLRLGVSADRGRRPDLAVYFPGRTLQSRGLVRTPPDIVVEVVTPTARDERRDRIDKMTEYAVFGVSWYWIVDPALGSVEIFERLPSGAYAKVVGATSGVVSPVPGCSGLTVDVDALWRRLARLAPS